MPSPLRKTPRLVPSGDTLDLAAIPRPNHLLWGKTPLPPDSLYVGWFLNGLPLLNGDILEWRRAENDWLPVAYRVSYVSDAGEDDECDVPEAGDRRYFADPATGQRLRWPSLVVPSAVFCWPSREALRIVNAYAREREQEHKAKRKRSVRT